MGGGVLALLNTSNAPKGGFGSPGEDRNHFCKFTKWYQFWFNYPLQFKMNLFYSLCVAGIMVYSSA